MVLFFSALKNRKRIPRAPKPILSSAVQVGQFLLTHYNKNVTIERSFRDKEEDILLSAYNHPLEAYFSWKEKKYSGYITVGKNTLQVFSPSEVSCALGELKPYMDELLKWDYSLRS